MHYPCYDCAKEKGRTPLDRFREKWPNVVMIQIWPGDAPGKHRDKEVGPEIESFLTTALAEEYARGREDALGEVMEKLAKQERLSVDGHDYLDTCKIWPTITKLKESARTHE